jgi:hypothetical protein
MDKYRLAENDKVSLKKKISEMMVSTAMLNEKCNNLEK